VTEVFAGALVRSAHQVNLRQRVEDGAGGFVELDRAAHFERPRQDLLRAFEIAQLHEDLPERRERDREPVAGRECLVQGDAALGECQRLLVLMAHERHVRLVVHDSGKHVVGLDGHRQPLALAERGTGFLAAAGLCEQHGGEGVHQREMTAIPRSVERGRGFREMLADDAGVADLLVAERELVVREADGPRIVRELGVLQRAGMERDRARLFTAGVRDAPVQAPQCRELRIADRLAQRVGGTSKRGRGLGEIILEQPGFGEH